MKTIETTVFEFNELTDKAKDKAREWYREGALQHEWWESIYDDAENIGLKIKSFDLDRNRHATGEFNCIGGAEQCANLILSEHGDTCETFKTATAWLGELKKLNAKIEAVDGDDETNVEWELWQDKRGMLCDEFLKSILEDYLIMLQNEMEYQLAYEQVDEVIIANGYTFTESGKRYG